MEKVKKNLTFAVGRRLLFLLSALSMKFLAAFLIPSVALASHEWCNGTSENALYAFEWQPVGDLDEGKGVMFIRNTKTNKVFQKLEGRRYNYYNESKVEEGVVEILDLNFDGCPDIRWEENSGASGNTTYAVFLFNQFSGVFQISRPLSEITGLDIWDFNKKLLSGFHTMGGGSAYGAVYYWNNKKKLVQIGIIETEWNEKEECFKHKMYKIHGKKTKLVTQTCTNEINWSR